MFVYRPEVVWRRGDGQMITVKTNGKKRKSKIKFKVHISKFLSFVKWSSCNMIQALHKCKF